MTILIFYVFMLLTRLPQTDFQIVQLLEHIPMIEKNIHS